MDKLKQWVALAVVASVLIVAAGWFLAISPKRAEAEELRVQASDQLATNQMLETQLQMLKAQAKELPKEQAKLAAVSAKIPSDPALPGLVRALLEAAANSGVELVSVAPGTPELLVVAAPAPVEAPAEGQTTPATDPAAPVDPAAAAAPGGTAGQLARIPVAINVVGHYFEVQQFMSALEQLPRALRVDNLSLTPGKSPTDRSETDVEDGHILTSQISGLVFMAADRPVATAATVPADAAAPADATADPAATTATPAS
jgi:Tfp pilus assembly protein PilO